MKTNNQYATVVSLITYLPEDEIQKILIDHDKHIDSSCRIYHDKDTAEPHTHIIIYLNSSRIIDEVKNWFAFEGVNTFAEKHTYGKASTIRYLTHTDDDSIARKKSTYDLDNIKYFKCDFSFFCKERKDVTFQILEDYLNGVPLRLLAFNYGRDFIYHFNAIMELASAIKAQEGVTPDE